MASDLAPKERLLRHGAQGLSDAELLAVVLRNGSRGIPALRTAERLLEAAGNLEGLLTADGQALRSYGVSDSRASILLATREILRRLSRRRIARGRLLDRPSAVAWYLWLRFARDRQEVSGALYLDSQQRLIREREIFRGGLCEVPVEPAPILLDAIRHRAARFVLFHTHLCGDPTPSRHDLAFTRRMAQAGDLLGVPMDDHLILAAGGRWVSLSARGDCSRW